MGENKQVGMLRTVVVIGIIAMAALIITLGVVGLKNNMSKNTDSAVGTVVTTKIPFTFVDQHYKYEWANLSRLHSGTSDGSGYDLNITSVEAATYDDKYNK